MTASVSAAPSPNPPGDLVRAAQRIASEVAGVHAAAVDAAARFPREAVGALRDAGLLGAAIPVEDGGFGLDLSTVSAITTELAEHCASTAMIFAMHQIQVFCLIRHARNARLRRFVERIACEQLLIASATTEMSSGGDTRSSGCAVEPMPDNAIRLEKAAPVISYGRFADGVLATARRDASSRASDQSLVLCANDQSASLQLTETSGWDTLGLRGTCSSGFQLRATAPAEYVLDDPFAVISSATMAPVSHILWAAMWLGLARSATDNARKVVLAESRKNAAATPPGALRLAELMVSMQQLEQSVRGVTREYLTICADFDATSDLGFVTSINTLKVSASTLANDIIFRAALICGIAGYRNDSPLSVARVVRDGLGASVMINNDRILHNNAILLLGVRAR